MARSETPDLDAQATGLDQLKKLIASGEFHHATYREQGTIWEGLWIYKNSLDHRRGFEVVGCIPGRVGVKSSILDEAYALIPGAHLCVGSFGKG